MAVELLLPMAESYGTVSVDVGTIYLGGKMLDKNSELAFMGSCVLVTMKKGDIYVMNVGDSRAVHCKIRQDLERIDEEMMMTHLEGCERDQSSLVPNLSAFQHRVVEVN